MYLKRSLVWVFLIIPVMPVLFWITQKPLSLRFPSFYVTLVSLGQVSALVGMSLFAVALILSSKLKIFDRTMRGLNRVYINHHLIGTAAFILLLLHPIFLASSYAIFSVKQAFIFLLPNLSNIPNTLGGLALFLLIALLIITFYFAIKYHVWKFLHRFLGLAFLVAFFHLFLIPSDVSVNMPLRIYMLSLSLFALGFYFYHVFLQGKIKQKFEYIISKVEHYGSITEISMKPKVAKLKYKSGQFAFFSFLDASVSKEQHPFSFASAPSDSELFICAKNLGDYTSHMGDLKPNSSVFIDGPYGYFNFEHSENKKQIWIAGGIGITPFLSMAKSLQESDYYVDLYWGVKTKSEAFCLDELQRIASNGHLRVIPVYSEEGNRVSAKYIESAGSELENKDIFICGPLVMMKDLKRQFLELGVPKKFIHSEEFEL